MRLLYVVASYLLFFLLSPVLLLHRKTRPGLLERLGFYSSGKLPEGGGPRIWLHGASAGDLLALSPMIKTLRARFPDCRIILSTITNSGYLMGNERLRGLVDAVIYAPYDLLGATRRAAREIRPDLLVLEYTEIWPNLIAAAKGVGSRLVLTNGRFSPSHLPRYRLLFGLIGNPLRQFDLLLMREPDEADRARALGAPEDRVRVTGNTKFDAQLTASLRDEDGPLREALGLRSGEPVRIAGSTHEGEEDKVLGVFSRLRAEHPNLKLVIAPRYIDRADRIVSMALEAGFEAGRRSTPPNDRKQVVVLDTIGELADAYRLGTAVFVGGSFTRRGGQNILEPAAQGRPVLFGPHMDNFRDSVQVLVGRGGIQVKDPEHLYRVLSELFARPDKIASLGQLAQSVVSQISGASRTNVDLMAGLLGGVEGESARVPAA